MKTCPECGMQIPNDIAYCLYCGIKTNTSKEIKRNRILFFLSPIFFLIFCLGLTYDLGAQNYFEAGISLSGKVIIVYFFGALLFGIIKLFFKIKSSPNSFYISAITSIINALTTIIASYSIETLFLDNFFNSLGPTDRFKYHIFLLLSIFIIIQILETIAISLKAKVTENPEFANTVAKKIFSNYLFIEIPIDFFIVTSICFYFTSYPDKILLLSKTMINISAKEKANKYLDSLISNYPDNAKVCYLKSYVLTNSDSLLSDTNNKKEAYNLAKKASNLKPNSPIYMYYFSIQQEINGDFNNAIETASKAANLAKTDGYLWQNLGDINVRHLRYSEAIEAYKKALQIDHNNSYVLNNLSVSLLYNNQNLNTALELAQEAIKLNPNSVAIIDTLAWAYYKNNKYSEALETINILYKNQSEISPELDFHYAAILDEMGLLKDPIKTYDKMIIKPEIASNFVLLNQIIEQRNKAEKRKLMK